jgi:hypothetical protein
MLAIHPTLIQGWNLIITLPQKGYTVRFSPLGSYTHGKFSQPNQKQLKREKQLKSAQGRLFIRSLIEKD